MRHKNITESDALYDDLEMSVLHKISMAVVQRKNVSELMSETLEILNSQMGLLRGTITLRDGDYLFIEASHTMNPECIKRGVYKIGEGVTGKVAKDAKSIIIKDISKDPIFLNRTETRGRASLADTAFVCVPIIYMEQVIGTLSIDRPVTKETNLKRDLELLETVANILADALAQIYLRYEERNKLLDENRRLKRELGAEITRPQNVIGNCGSMRKVYSSMMSVKNAKSVFIRGESGTGKKLIAKALAQSCHAKSFNVLNCAALPDYSLISEIFGYEKSMHQGSSQTKKGLFEEAQNGVVFFDEIEEISPEAQKQLAQYLTTNKFKRLNSNKEINAKVRLYFSSSVDIEKLLDQGKFDKNLYDIISQSSIFLPALRDRKSDILLLAEFFLEKFNKVYNKNVKRISAPAINMMNIYPWPGNVRELESCVERAVMSSNDDVISGYNLPKEIRAAYATRRLPFGEDADFTSIVESFERELISEALKSTRGNASAAAKVLNLSQRILNYKIKNYSIDTAWFKNSK